MTPGAPSPGGYNPHTPGSNIEQGSGDWVTTDILVRVKDSFMDLMGQIGVIRSVTGGMCSVFMQESEKVVSISSDHLEPVTPTKNNKVSPQPQSLSWTLKSQLYLKMFWFCTLILLFEVKRQHEVGCVEHPRITAGGKIF
ncbi:Transcription elongation factor SPT5 [Goodea atripinnis]|uniref:Transcription elongation factor SPT5 n=1 Tax=Goodea atripinnis TaxID=208336 RepID=A0ABV0Q0Y1_9TELE